MIRTETLAERTGKYYKLFSLTIEGTKFYFIGSITRGGAQWVYRRSEDAVDTFEKLEEQGKELHEIFRRRKSHHD